MFVKKYIVFVSLLLIGVFVFLIKPQNVWAWESENITEQNCAYGSTQARVQLNTSDPWKQDMSVNPGEQFNVGGFHDGTGQFADDVNIVVTGPSHMSQTAVNGQTITDLQPGFFYYVHVTTNNQTGGGCTQTASVYVRRIPVERTITRYSPVRGRCNCNYPVQQPVIKPTNVSLNQNRVCPNSFQN